ncbi:MAG: phosphate ABC transporter permease PstA [Deltaproteobacteria bacterium]|nr:phosphate ABC transporter permease PstA [Deltaproteobacteria bacterium]
MSSDGAGRPERREEVEERADRRLRRRYASERAFRTAGLVAIAFSLSALGALLGSIVLDATGALTVHSVRLELDLDPAQLDPYGDRSPDSLASGNAAAVLRSGLASEFPEVTGRSEKRALGELLSVGASYDLLDRIVAEPELLGSRLEFRALLSDDADLALRGETEEGVDEADRKLSGAQQAWLASLSERGRIENHWNLRFLTTGDSRDPEIAGVQGAIRGSFLTLIVTLLLSFPLGVAAAIYLEEFAPRNRLTDLIEVNINNLAAVPSIVFGLLGLAVFLNVFGLPRSAPLVGGMVLGLMTLPTVIIAARAALSAVPPSIREAALGVGASPTQAVLHHVVPQALPGILTGTIIGMARALGETAPLLMIGMVAFIVDLPTGPTDPSTVLPVQIYLWAEAPERAFAARTAAAILVLLGFLVTMNSVAVWVRRRFESRV